MFAALDVQHMRATNSADPNMTPKVDWAGIGPKWLLQADFYKVTVQAQSALTRESLAGLGADLKRSKPEHRRYRRRNSGASSVASSWWSVATSDVASLPDATPDEETERRTMTYWEVDMLYDALTPLILRESEDINSARVAELPQGVRALLVDFGIESSRRVKVVSGAGDFKGWTSRETTEGRFFVEGGG